MSDNPKEDKKEEKKSMFGNLSGWAEKAKAAVNDTMKSEKMKELMDAAGKMAEKTKDAAIKGAKDAADMAEKTTKSFMKKDEGKKEEEKKEDEKK